MGVLNNLRRIRKLEKSGGGGSSVSVQQLIDEGTNIANITVDGKTTSLYAPAGSATSTSLDLLNEFTHNNSFTLEDSWIRSDGHQVSMHLDARAENIEAGSFANIQIDGMAASLMPAGQIVVRFPVSIWVNNQFVASGRGLMSVAGGISLYPDGMFNIEVPSSISAPYNVAFIADLNYFLN